MIEKIDEKGCTIVDESRGENWMRFYPNSDFGRTAIINDYPDIAVDIIGDGKVWGDEPYYT